MKLYLFLASTLLAMPIDAQIDAQNCSTLSSSDARLACYDRLALCRNERTDSKRLACFDARSMAAPTAEHLIEINQPTDDEAFPMEKPVSDSPRKEIRSRITKVQKGAYSATLLTLENGQTWRIKEKSRHKFKGGQTVVIRDGTLGSIWLKLEGRNKGYRAKRER